MGRLKPRLSNGSGEEAVPRDASRLIQDPARPINNIGEFVVLAVEFFRTRRAQKSCATQFPASCGSQPSGFCQRE